jgi:hypothetical protein
LGAIVLFGLAWWGVALLRSSPPASGSRGDESAGADGAEDGAVERPPVLAGLPPEPLPLSAPGRDAHLNQLVEAARATAAAMDPQALAALASRHTELLSRSGEIPRPRRWQFFVPDGLTTREYARILDALGIELAVVTRSELQYVRQLSDPMPQRRSGPAQDERRLYLAWEHGRLEEADRELLRAAGLDPAGGVILHLLPTELEEKMAALEQQFANRQPSAIRTTRFSVRYGEGGYEVYVVQQDPLR